VPAFVEEMEIDRSDLIGVGVRIDVDRRHGQAVP
jgi:hypothetical protein